MTGRHASDYSALMELLTNWPVDYRPKHRAFKHRHLYSFNREVLTLRDGIDVYRPDHRSPFGSVR